MKITRIKQLMRGAFALVLVCFLLPVTALAAEFSVDSMQLGPKGFTTQLGGMDRAQSVNLAEYKTDGKAGTGSISWDPATQTITLDNAQPVANDETVAVLDFNCEPLETITLHLKGENVINTTGNPNADALRFDTNVIIEAEPDASLEIVGDRNGIYMPSGTLTVKSGTVKIDVKGTGLNVGKDIVLEKDAVLDVTSHEDAAILAVNGTVQIGSGKVSVCSASKVPAIVGRTSGVTDTAERAKDHIVLAEGLQAKGYKIVTGQWQEAGDSTFYADTVFAPEKTALDENGLLPNGTKVPSKVQITVSDEKPVDPEKPVNPENPENPQNPDSPQSGDKMPMTMLIVLLVVSAVAICVLVICKRRKA